MKYEYEGKSSLLWKGTEDMATRSHLLTYFGESWKSQQKLVFLVLVYHLGLYYYYYLLNKVRGRVSLIT